MSSSKIEILIMRFVLFNAVFICCHALLCFINLLCLHGPGTCDSKSVHETGRERKKRLLIYEVMMSEFKFNEGKREGYMRKVFCFTLYFPSVNASMV